MIEQRGVEDHVVDLLRGSFRFDAVLGSRTLVTLSTTYRPRMSARAIWRPWERALATVLHEHVLDGMALPPRRERNVAAPST